MCKTNEPHFYGLILFKKKYYELEKKSISLILQLQKGKMVFQLYLKWFQRSM